MELHHCTQLILDLAFIVDQGAVTDPCETWRHVLDGDLFTWLPPQFKALDPNFLFVFEPGGGSENEGLEILFALSEGRVVRHVRSDNNGLATLLRMIAFLIQDNFPNTPKEKKFFNPDAPWPGLDPSALWDSHPRDDQ